MHSFSARLIYITVIIIVSIARERFILAAKLRKQDLKDKVSPTGGYRTTIGTEETISTERFVNQLSPGVRSSTHFSTALSPLSLEDPETADPPKGPVTFRIQDHSPWRPMVSESAASHRVHKSTFAKGFKFHTFADEKHVPAVTSSIGRVPSYTDSAHKNTHHGAHFLVPSRQQHRLRQKHNEPNYSHHHEPDQPEYYPYHLPNDEKHGLTHHGHLHQTVVGRRPSDHSPQYALEHHFRDTDQPTTSSHSRKQHQKHDQRVRELHSTAPYIQQQTHYQPRQDLHLQQQHQRGHDQVRYVFVDEQAAVRSSKRANPIPTEHASAGRQSQYPAHLEQQQQQQRLQYAPHEVRVQYTSQIPREHSTGKDEEEPSDDVLLAHIPLQKAKIAVEMDDVNDRQHPDHGQKLLHQQDSTHNTGPIYRVINSADNKEISVGSAGRSLEYDFKQHPKTTHAKRQDALHNLQSATYQSVTPTRGRTLRQARQFTVRASAVTPRTHHRLYPQAQAYIMPERYPLHQAFFRTPANLQTSFRKATLHRALTGPSKPLSYTPIVIRHDGRLHSHAAQAVTLIAQDITTDRKQLLHNRQPSFMNSVIPERKGYLTKFPFSEQDVTQVPSLTQDIHTYIKKKAA